MRDSHLRRSDISHASKQIKHFFERDISAAENVALSNATLFFGQHVPFCTVAHVDEVHARIDIAEHLAPKEVDDDLPGWSWFDVQVANRSAGVDDKDGQAARRPISH